MKVIALEEHFRNETVDAEMGTNYFRTINSAGEQMMRHLSDLTEVGERRIADMDQQGVALQAISLTSPMLYWADEELSYKLARAWNDAASQAHQAHPTRLAAFLTLPMLYPDRALDELNRFSGALAKQTGTIGAALWVAAVARSPLLL